MHYNHTANLSQKDSYMPFRKRFLFFRRKLVEKNFRIIQVFNQKESLRIMII